jgi:hypothetical protein
VADREIVWKGITLGGQGSYIVTEVTGWDEMPGLTDMSVSRVRGHGKHLGDQFSQSRIVTVSGTIVDDPGLRDTLATALQDATVVTSALDTLTLTVFGRQLSTDARVTRRMVSAGATYEVGAIPFALQWECPDPLRYDVAQTVGPVGLPTSGGGLVYPLAYPLDYGTTSTPGMLSLTNTGTADTSVLFTVTGSLPLGFEISSATGQRLTYPDPLFSGDVLTLDTATGAVLLGGTADRRNSLTVADWMQVPAGGSLSVRFSSLGGAYDAAATLTATMRPAYW